MYRSFRLLILVFLLIPMSLLQAQDKSSQAEALDAFWVEESGKVTLKAMLRPTTKTPSWSMP